MNPSDILTRRVYYNRTAKGDGEEAEDLVRMNKIVAALPHAGILDLIFYDDRELEPEQVVDEAMRREAEYVAKHGAG